MKVSVALSAREERTGGRMAEAAAGDARDAELLRCRIQPNQFQA
jgi:hypothetical protein